MLGLVTELVTIGEFSARCGLSAKMLRSYAAAGLLVPAAVDQVSGYRYYLAGQAHRVGLRQFGEHLSCGTDPVLRILLRPARLRGRERVLALRARDHLAGGVERERFHAGRADVEPDDHGTAQAPSAAYTSS